MILKYLVSFKPKLIDSELWMGGGKPDLIPQQFSTP